MKDARLAFELQAYNDAEDLLLEVLEFAPHETRAWKLLARTQKELGKTNQAIASATRALELQHSSRKPADIPASATLARLLWEQGEVQAARAMLGVLLMRQPDNAELTGLKHQWEAEASA
ncbi:MAG TPA: tetratricopeptide repeat protein [Mariprofundaceae bacterium]|nr:tetratricopeptide repeat protein [Mariprofundaceae bacterium]